MSFYTVDQKDYVGRVNAHPYDNPLFNGEFGYFFQNRSRFKTVFFVGAAKDDIYIYSSMIPPKPQVTFYLFEPNCTFMKALKDSLDQVEVHVLYHHYGISDKEETLLLDRESGSCVVGADRTPIGIWANEVFYPNLASKPKTADEIVKLRDEAWAKLDQPTREDYEKCLVKEEIPCHTLAFVCKRDEVTQIDYLKIDVEGMECKVLRGIDWKATKVKEVQLEYSDHWKKAGESLKDLLLYLAQQGLKWRLFSLTHLGHAPLDFQGDDFRHRNLLIRFLE